MTQLGYLFISIAVLASLAGLALGCFLYLNRGRKKTSRKACAGCEQADCPIVAKLREREENE